MKIANLFFLACMFSVALAHAEPVPETALDHDFTACMGGMSPQQDYQRAAYCNCIRDRMQGWDLDTYGNVAMEQSQAGTTKQVSQKIQDVAQECIAKVLK